MNVVKDESFGIIPFCKQGDDWKVFLIHQYGTGDVFWTFPKGHAEAGESPEYAAKRELLEETGIIVVELATDTPLMQSYQFQQEGVTISKTVTYFVGIAKDPSHALQVEEVKDGGWFSCAAARERLTHDSAKQLLDEAVARLTTWKKV